MARQPLFQSETTRMRIIGVVMASLLAIALLLAMAFSTYFARVPPKRVAGGNHWITIGQHAFAIPPGWEVDSDAAPWPLETSHVTLLRRDVPMERMIFSTLPDMGTCSPQVAMQRAAEIFFRSNEFHPFHQQPFRQGSFVGRIMAVREKAGHPNRPAMRHLLAIYTQDGRYYQFIHHMAMESDLAAEGKKPFASVDAARALAMVLHMAKASANDRFTEADAQALAKANVAKSPSEEDGPQPPDRWLLGHSGHWHEDSPALTLLPATGHEGFWQARMLGGIAPPEDTSDDTLSPQAQLEALGMQAQNHEDGTPAYRITRIDHPPARQGWKIVFFPPPPEVPPGTSPENRESTEASQFSGDASGDGLVRENWYLPTRDGRDVLLVELLAEADALAQARTSLASAIEALKLESVFTRGHEQSDAWQSLLARGRQMAQAMAGDLQGKFRLGPQYSLFFVDAHPAGFMLHHVRIAAGSLPLRGELRMFHLTQPGHVHEEDWAVSADGERMWLTSASVQRGANQPTAVRNAMRYEMADGVMRLFDLSSGQEKRLWQAEAPSALIPWVWADRLETAQLEAWSKTQGGIVWRTMNNQPPAPCLMRVERLKGGDNHAPRWRVSVRPLASPHENAYLFDRDGWVIQYHWRLHDISQGSAMQLSVIKSDRQTIIQAFDRWRPDIMTWEKQVSASDQESNHE